MLLVSEQVLGTTGFHEVLLRYHGKGIRPAQRPEWRPRPAFLDWHEREVFKRAARHLPSLHAEPKA